jgi:TRAP-type C4-dicarboxylate transport system permease small subunit
MDIVGRALDRLMQWLLALGMAAASLAMLGQVFCRYVLSAPLSWPEEFTVLLFAWLIFLGSAYVQRTDSHLSIDSLRRAASPRLAFALDAFRLIVIAACGAVLIWQGIALTLRTLPLLYPAMGVSRALLYASVPVCFAVGLIFLVLDVAERWRSAPADKDPDA